MTLLGIIEMLGGVPECSRALGVSPATIRHWMRTNPRGFFKYTPELTKLMRRQLRTERPHEILTFAVTAAEQELRA